MSGGVDPSSLGIGGVLTGIVAAVGLYAKDRRRTAADVERDEALLPMDLVTQATTIAKDQITSIYAELERLRGRLVASEDENDRLRGRLIDSVNENDRLRHELRETRELLEHANVALQEAWRRLHDIDPQGGPPPWEPVGG